MWLTYEPREKTGFLHIREADQRLCFRYTYSTIPLLPKSKISSLQPSVCVGSGRKSRRPVFSQRGSYATVTIYTSHLTIDTVEKDDVYIILRKYLYMKWSQFHTVKVLNS